MQNAAPISYIPFEVNPSRVKGLFEAWKQQLWFAPGDFKNSTSNPRFDGIFVPFYAVGAEVTTRFRYEVTVAVRGASIHSRDAA